MCGTSRGMVEAFRAWFTSESGHQEEFHCGRNYTKSEDCFIKCEQGDHKWAYTKLGS